MSEAFMGPEYCLTIKCESNEHAVKMRNALVGEQGDVNAALKEGPAKELWDLYLYFVNAYVGAADFDHDGYDFKWDQAPDVLLDSDDPGATEVIVFFGINVGVKAEDFDHFDDLLQGEGLRSDYLQEVKRVFLKHILSSGVKCSATDLAVEESGFGYD